jgi:hypothetical protein
MPSEITRGRREERGAALVMSLLVAMLLLAAGGALIATAGMTVSNAVDSTAETQAYYAADAGLQAALTVIRRNRASTTSGLKANSHNFACGTAANCVNDGNDLAQWLGTMPRSLGAGTGLDYTLTVTDPSQPPDANLPATYFPRYLHVRSVGRGPRGAVKVMEMMVDDYSFEFTARAAVALHSHDTDSTPMTTFAIGQSNPHLWNGNDLATPPAGNLPAFAVTNTADFDAGDGLAVGSAQGKVEGAIRKDPGNVVGSAQLQKLTTADLDWWLKDANSARSLLTQLRAKAVKEGRLMNTSSTDFGTDTDPKFSFVDGDVDFTGSSSSGAGLLVLTGKYLQGGSAQFKGIILVLGDGVVERNGNPDNYGAMVVAQFEHVYNSTTKAYTGTGGFTSPSLTTDGGGNSLVGYNSEWVRKAMEALGPRAVGIVER